MVGGVLLSTGSRRPNDSSRGLSAAYVSDVLALLFDAMRSGWLSCGSGPHLCAQKAVSVRFPAVL